MGVVPSFEFARLPIAKMALRVQKNDLLHPKAIGGQVWTAIATLPNPPYW